MKKVFFLTLLLGNAFSFAHNEDACKATRSDLSDAQKAFTEALNNDLSNWTIPIASMLTAENLKKAMANHTDCINEKTRSAYKSNAPKAKRVQEACSSLQTLFLNSKDSDAEAALERFEACQKQELAKLYEKKKEKKQ